MVRVFDEKAVAVSLLVPTERSFAHTFTNLYTSGTWNFLLGCARFVCLNLLNFMA